MNPNDESVWRTVWRATMPENLVFLLPSVFIVGGVSYHAVTAGSIPRLASELSLWLPLATLQCLTPVFADRGRGFAWLRWRTKRPMADGEQRSDPGDMATAQAVFAGVGAACLGVALGANLVASAFGDGGSGVTTNLRRLLAGGTVMGLAGLLYRLTSSMRSLYLWSQSVAAAAAATDTELVRARVAALEAQMNPHFLFNALNTVASLVRTDGSRARRTAAHLSDLLRQTLARSGSPTTTVRDEIAFVRDYLQIEQERFGARLTVTYDIPDDTLDLLVPAMSLQPLVENAVKHAVATRIEGGRITISARRLQDRQMVRLAVADDGPGFPPGHVEWTGLTNLRARLTSLYEGRALTLIDSRDTGARVSLDIPIA